VLTNSILFPLEKKAAESGISSTVISSFRNCEVLELKLLDKAILKFHSCIILQ
jgi:hypothetical protein